MNHRLVRLVPLLLLCVAAALPSLADITLGNNARSVGMGGAGLASGDAPESSSLNPAFLADTGFRLGIEMPSMSTRLDGATFGDALSLIMDPSLDAEDALDYAVKLGTSTKQIEASASTGLLLPHMDLRLTASALTKIEPDESFKQWARSGGEGAPPSGAQADVYAGGITNLPSVGAGIRLPLGTVVRGDIRVGVRVKPTTAYYSHYIIDADAVENGEPRLASEMGDKEYLKSTSLSADLGAVYTPTSLPNMRVALVVNNLIEPKAISFASDEMSGMFSTQLAPRTVSVGAAYVLDMLTLAVDLVDLTGETGDAQFRAGSELRLPGGLALRGGYNNTCGFTAGVGLGGFGIAISEKTPFMLSQNIVF